MFLDNVEWCNKEQVASCKLDRDKNFLLKFFSMDRNWEHMVIDGAFKDKEKKLI